jgi:hypothetical protein
MTNSTTSTSLFAFDPPWSYFSAPAQITPKLPKAAQQPLKAMLPTIDEEKKSEDPPKSKPLSERAPIDISSLDDDADESCLWSQNGSNPIQDPDEVSDRCIQTTITKWNARIKPLRSAWQQYRSNLAESAATPLSLIGAKPLFSCEVHQKIWGVYERFMDWVTTGASFGSLDAELNPDNYPFLENGTALVTKHKEE